VGGDRRGAQRGGSGGARVGSAVGMGVVPLLGLPSAQVGIIVGREFEQQSARSWESQWVLYSGDEGWRN